MDLINKCGEGGGGQKFRNFGRLRHWVHTYEIMQLRADLLAMLCTMKDCPLIERPSFTNGGNLSVGDHFLSSGATIPVSDVWQKHSGLGYQVGPKLRGCCRQGHSEVVGICKNQNHQTWDPFYSRTLYW